MKSIVSAGLNKNVALSRIPVINPQINGSCFPNQCLNPPIFPLIACPNMKINTNTPVKILISGRLCHADVRSQVASNPMKVFKLRHIIPVSSNRKINQVMKMKY